MRKSPWFWLVAVLVLLVGGKYVANTFFGPSDAVLIRKSLDEAIEASREGRPGGVLEYISDSFKLNGATFGGSDIASFIRNQKPDVTIDYTEPRVSGEYAKMTAPVHVKVALLGFSQEVPLKEVTMTFHRETTHDWLMLPVKTWRLQSATVPQKDIPADLGGFDR